MNQSLDKIVDATYVYDYGGGNDCQSRASRLRALTMLMRWSGLSILDAASLERDRLSKSEDGDAQIFLYRAKTNVPVYVVIPPDVADLLHSCLTQIRVTSSGPATAIPAARPKPFSAHIGSSSNWRTFSSQTTKGSAAIPTCSGIPLPSSCSSQAIPSTKCPFC